MHVVLGEKNTVLKVGMYKSCTKWHFSALPLWLAVLFKNIAS